MEKVGIEFMGTVRGIRTLPARDTHFLRGTQRSAIGTHHVVDI